VTGRESVGRPRPMPVDSGPIPVITPEEVAVIRAKRAAAARAKSAAGEWPVDLRSDERPDQAQIPDSDRPSDSDPAVNPERDHASAGVGGSARHFQ